MRCVSMQSGAKKMTLVIPRGKQLDYAGKRYFPNAVKFDFLCAECHAPLRHTMNDAGDDVFLCANDEAHDGIILKSFLEMSEQDARELEMERRERVRHDLIGIAEKHYPVVYEFLDSRCKRDAELLYPREEP